MLERNGLVRAVRLDTQLERMSLGRQETVDENYMKAEVLTTRKRINKQWHAINKSKMIWRDLALGISDDKASVRVCAYKL